MFRITARSARIVIASLVVLVIFAAAASRTGYGNICAFGARLVSFVCPLGFLQVALASRSLLPQLWLSVGLVVLSVVVLGRFFCAWVCPSALLQDIFGGRRAESAGDNRERANHAVVQSSAFSSRSNRPLDVVSNKTSWASRSRYAILGGTLLSSFVLGFPVFCAICPVGLFFGSLFAVSRLFSTRQPSLELLLFPALLGVELVVLKSWCRSICPLGALLGLMGRLNLFLRPVVQQDQCLVPKGVHCRVCERVCAEEIALVPGGVGTPLGDCTKCLECYEKCPVRAIRLASPR